MAGEDCFETESDLEVLGATKFFPKPVSVAVDFLTTVERERTFGALKFLPKEELLTGVESLILSTACLNVPPEWVCGADTTFESVRFFGISFKNLLGE